MAVNPTRFRRTTRVTFGGAGQAAAPIFTPLTVQDILNVRQLTISSDAAAEIVVYFGNAAADRLDIDNAIVGLFMGANGGGSPDLGCIGSWSPNNGLPIQIWASAACNVWVTVAGVVES